MKTIIRVKKTDTFTWFTKPESIIKAIVNGGECVIHYEDDKGISINDCLLSEIIGETVIIGDEQTQVGK